MLLVARLGNAGVHLGPGGLLGGLLGGPLGGNLLRLLPVLVDQLFSGPVGALLGGGAAVADGSVHIVPVFKGQLFEKVGFQLRVGQSGQRQSAILPYGFLNILVGIPGLAHGCYRAVRGRLLFLLI